MADIVKGRVIYRGYAPKNTYFYIKTVKSKVIYEIQHIIKPKNMESLTHALIMS